MKVLIRYFPGSLIMMMALVFCLHTTVNAGYSSAQKKIMAKRAARMDALRNLTETIYGTSIDSETIVEDMVVKSDKIKTRLDALIKGATETDSKFNDDGSAEVTLEIELGPVTDILGTTVNFDGKVFKAVGMGAPPSDEDKKSAGSSGSSVGPMDSDTSDGYLIKATGYGAAPDDPNMVKAQKSSLGFRAAEVDAKRQLLETALGVKVSSDTYIVDMVTKSDKIEAKVKGYIKGAIVVERRVNDGIYEVDVEIELAPLIESTDWD